MQGPYGRPWPLLRAAAVVAAVALLVAAPAAAAPPSAVYVEDAWSSVSSGADPDGAGPATEMGVDAFATIQAGIDAVAAGGTVHVSAGSYPELIRITKAVTLAGANAGVDPNTGVRSGESTIDAGGGGGTDNGILVYANAADVTIDGFEFTGVAGHVSGGYETGVVIVKPNVDGGIAYPNQPTNHVENLTIANNVFEDITGRGILKDNFATFDGLHILGNLFRNVSAPGKEYSAVKIQAGCSWSGCPPNRDLEIRGNVIDTTSYSGILVSDVDGVVIAGNTISGVPIHGINLAADTVTGDTLIEGNTIEDAGTGAGGDAAVRIKPGVYDGSVLVRDNTVADSRIGILVEDGADVSGAFTVTGNRFSGNDEAAVENLDAAELDASGNWWGASSGPGSVANVIVQPWCTVGDCSVESDDAELSSLSLSSGVLAPAFSPSTTSYAAGVGNSTAGVVVNRTATPGATTTVAGGAALSVGVNTISVLVTSADGTVTRTYTIAVSRAAPSPPPPPPPPPTPVVTAVSPPATAVVNEPRSVAAAPGQAGAVGVAVAPAGPAVPVSVEVAWEPDTFAVPVTVLVTPRPEQGEVGVEASPATEPPPVAGGFAVGSAVVQVSVTDGSGVAVTEFDAPLVIRLSAIGPDEVPSFSTDGTSWTTIPRLAFRVLPAGQPDGYYVNEDGSVDIFTRHATLFGALVDVRAPTRVAVRGRVTRKYVRIRWRGARDNVAVLDYVVSRNGHGYRATKRTHIALPLRPGRYVVRVRDAAGNVSRASRVITIVRTHDPRHPLRVER